MTSEEGIVLEELHGLIMILSARHDKHGASEALGRDNRNASAIFKFCRVWRKIMRVHLNLEKALSQDLEECLVAGKPDVKLALGSWIAETTPLATGEDDDTNLTVFDKLIANRTVGGFIDSRHSCLIADHIFFDSVEVRTILLTRLNDLRTHNKIFIELIDMVNIESTALLD